MHKRLDTILERSNPEIIELIFGTALFFWGLWVLNPLLSTFDSSMTYRSLQLMTPPYLNAEVFWGFIVAVSGLNQLISLLQDGHIGGWHRRSQAALWNTFLMLFLGANFQISNPTTPSLVWFCCFAWAERWAYHRIGRFK